MNITETFKEHPGIVLGGVAAGGFILYLLLSGSSSAPTASYSTGSTGIDPNVAALDAAQLQSQTQIQVAQIGAQSQQNQLQAAVAANHENDVLQNNLGTLAAYTTIQGDQINADASTKIAGINAGVANNQISAQLAAAQSADQVQRDQIAAGVNIANIEAQAGVANDYYTAATAINASNNNAATTAQLIGANQAIQLNAANQSASVAKKSSDNSLIGGLASAASAILSFL